MLTAMNALIVDDNPLVRWSLERTLAKRGIPGRGVETGQQAMLEVRRMSYELIILDIHLPDANGLDLLEEIRSISPGSKVVVISSHRSEDNVQRAIVGGAVRFMEKSCGPAWMVTEILEAIRPSRLAAGD